MSGYNFASCYSLRTISLPALTQISGYNFTYCYSLRTISLPALTQLYPPLFYECSAITEIDLPELTSIYTTDYLFSGYSSLYSLSRINLPKASLASAPRIPMSICPALQEITLGISYMHYSVFGWGQGYLSTNNVRILNLPYL